MTLVEQEGPLYNSTQLVALARRLRSSVSAKPLRLSKYFTQCIHYNLHR